MLKQVVQLNKIRDKGLGLYELLFFGFQEEERPLLLRGDLQGEVDRLGSGQDRTQNTADKGEKPGQFRIRPIEGQAKFSVHPSL